MLEPGAKIPVGVAQAHVVVGALPQVDEYPVGGAGHHGTREGAGEHVEWAVGVDRAHRRRDLLRQQIQADAGGASIGPQYLLRGQRNGPGCPGGQVYLQDLVLETAFYCHDGPPAMGLLKGPRRPAARIHFVRAIRTRIPVRSGAHLPLAGADAVKSGSPAGNPGPPGRRRPRRRGLTN